MSWTFKERGADSQVRRTFSCTDCGLEWTLWQTRDEAVPDCPTCALQAQRAIGLPGVLTNKSRAMDIAYDSMERMGYTDMNDNQREGDIAYKPPPEPTQAQRDEMTRRSLEVAAQMGIETGAPKLSDTPQIGRDGRPIEGAMSLKKMAENFWGGQIGPQAQPTMPTVPVETSLANAAPHAALARAEGVDPIAMLHAKRQPLKLDVVSRTREENIKL